MLNFHNNHNEIGLYVFIKGQQSEKSTNFLKQQRHQRGTIDMTTRRAKHAGSWYLSDGKALGKELEEWLKAASAKVKASNQCL